MFLTIIIIFFNIFMMLLSRKIYISRVNPIYIYNLIWLIIVLVYSTNWVYLNKLNNVTLLVILIFNLVLSFSMMLGMKNSYLNRVNKYTYDQQKLKKLLFKYILVLSLIGGISVLMKVTTLVSMFGINLLEYTNYIYNARLHEGLQLGIPYIGSLLSLSLVLTSIYITKFKFNMYLLIPIILSGVDALTSGGRRELIYSAMLFIYPILFGSHRMSSLYLYLKNNKFMFLVFFMALFLFNTITSNRSNYIEINSLMSPTMIMLVTTFSPAIYKNYIYLVGPLGVLNEFLKKPEFKFGDNTFLFFRSILSKIGLPVEVNKYQEPYYVPIELNVGTYIREVVLDFTLIGGIIVVLFVGYVIGYYFSKMKLKDSLQATFLSTVFLYILTFSFFMWEFRTAGIWILCIVGIPIMLHIEKKTKIQKEVKSI